MASSTLITDYMTFGTHAARPATPNVPTGGAALYYETDTTNTFVWNGTSWVQANATGGGASVVQTAANAGATVNTVTFGVAPTNGNLLIAMVLTSGSQSPATGWTRFTYNTDGSGIFWGDIFFKLAGAGEPTTQTPLTTAGNNTIVVFECANALPGPIKFQATSGTAPNITANAFGTGEIILGAISNSSSNALPTSFTGATAGVTAAGTATSIAAFTKSSPTKGLAANSITANYAASQTVKFATISIGLG